MFGAFGFGQGYFGQGPMIVVAVPGSVCFEDVAFRSPTIIEVAYAGPTTTEATLMSPSTTGIAYRRRCDHT